MAATSAVLLSACEASTLPSDVLHNWGTGDCYVTVWMNAFIHNAHGTPLPTGYPFAGFTAVGPILGYWYLTDQRGFSSVLGASARMHSRLDLRVPYSGRPGVIGSGDTTGQTVEITSSGVTCTAFAPTTGMAWGAVTAVGTSATRVPLSATASNPCMTGSPNVDYWGDVTVINRRTSPSRDVAVAFIGYVDEFPSFEMYATDGTNTVTIGTVANFANGPTAAYPPGYISFGSTQGGLCPHAIGGVLDGEQDPHPGSAMAARSAGRSTLPLTLSGRRSMSSAWNSWAPK